jgi:uncharacterized protein YkwD
MTMILQKTKTLALAAMLCVASPLGAGASCAQPEEAGTLQAGLLEWINAQRSEHGLAGLQPNRALSNAAMAHACDMAVRGYFSHQRPGGPDLKARLKTVGYGLRKAGENIAYSRQAKVSSAAEIWRNSPPHWKTIISPDYKDIGIAIAVSDEGRVYWVMDVGK